MREISSRPLNASPIDPLAAGAPDRDVVEVSIFGPGRGECVLVHVGEGDWLVVDSCVDQADKSHPALAYLDGLGIDVGTAVRLVVGTHAHDDHIAGLAEVYRRAESAHFVCSSALVSEEFFASVLADADIERRLRHSIRREYRDIFAEVTRRGTSSGVAELTRALQGRTLWSRTAAAVLPAAVVALSPSDHAVTRAIDALAKRVATAEGRRRLTSGDPNEFAVAIWIEVGQQRVLLGADLTAGPRGCGWGAVLATFSPDTKASVYKVAHHGAPNAHHDDLWPKLIADDAVALLAPYRAGKRFRPDPTDVTRICALSSHAFITASPDGVRASKGVRDSDVLLGTIASNIRDPWGKSGHVRWRGGANSAAWTVDTFAPARDMSSLRRR